MNQKKLKILAVNDPAVEVYVDSRYRILEKYKKDNIIIEFNVIPWEKYALEIEKIFIGDKTYDIIMIPGHLWLYELVERNLLEELAYEQEDVISSIFEEMKIRDRIYLSPSFCDGHMIVYRKKIMEESGVNLKKAITVDEFINIAERLKEKGMKTPVALKAHETEIFTDILPYLRSSGKDVYSIDESGRIKCNISEMYREILKYLKLKKLSPEGTENINNEGIKDMIIGGKVAMAVTWSGQLGIIAREVNDLKELGFSTLKTAWNVTWAFGIIKGSRNRKEAEGFLMYLRSEEIDRIVGKYCGAPIRKKSYLKGKAEFPWYEIQLNMIEKYSQPLISGNSTKSANEFLYQKFHKIFYYEKNIEQTLNETGKIINTMIG